MYDPEEIAQFDAYEPNDPKHPAYEDRILDAPPEIDDRPPMSPLGAMLLGLATSEAAAIVAIQRATKEDG